MRNFRALSLFLFIIFSSVLLMSGETAIALEPCTTSSGQVGFMSPSLGKCTVYLDVEAKTLKTDTNDSNEGLVPCGKGATACTLCDLVVGFKRLTEYLTKLLITITLAALFFSGVMYIISVGDDGMMTSAKNFMKASLIGFVVVLGAWLIINVTLWVISSDLPKATGKDKWYSFTPNCN